MPTGPTALNETVLAREGYSKKRAAENILDVDAVSDRLSSGGTYECKNSGFRGRTVHKRQSVKLDSS